MVFKRIVSVVQVAAVVLCVIAAVLLVTRKPPSKVVVATAPAPGAVVFAANCASCHGSDGLGTAAAPQLMGRVVAQYPNPDDEVAVVTNGKGRMPAFGGDLTAEQIRQVVDFTRGTGPSGGGTPTGTGGGPTIDANALYRLHCAGCHDDDGRGTYAKGVSFVDGAMKTIYPDPAEQAKVVVSGRGDMDPFADKLSPDEIAAIVAYTRDEL